MKTVQMTLDDELIQAVDKIAKKMHTTRSALTREALRDTIKKFQDMQLEQKHRIGYEKTPVIDEEFSVWETEHAWGDE
jgi:metal-responsive CopG/Arc/MetJ family transcriptional regulator